MVCIIEWGGREQLLGTTVATALLWKGEGEEGREGRERETERGREEGREGRERERERQREGGRRGEREERVKGEGAEGW